MSNTKAQIIKFSAYLQDELRQSWSEHHPKNIDPKLTAEELDILHQKG
jgi:hypothetical protein